MTDTLKVTQEQALWAVEIIRNIVDEAWKYGSRMATMIMLPHETTKQMRELIEEIRQNDRRD